MGLDFDRDNDVVDSFCLAYALRDLKQGKATLTIKPKRPKKRRKKTTKIKTSKTTKRKTSKKK
jgi:hypothetical protein